MRVLVVTVVHNPLDARIHARQIAALRMAGHDVTYVAPFTGHGISPSAVHPGVTTFDVPRARGRSRLRSWVGARRRLAQLAARHDVVLLHDPELLLAVVGLRALRGCVVVLDVHEDTGAALTDKAWLPAWARSAVASLVRLAEAWAQRRLRLLLAEQRYADRLSGGADGPHPVVPNTSMVPDVAPEGPDDPPRVVQVGRLSVQRGARELLAAAARLQGEVEVHLIGPADADVTAELQAAHEAGTVTWHGFLPNEQALVHLDGALAGLCLLHDTPNYRQSMPTKVLEYLARAVPVVTTPIPLGVEVVEAADAGIVVPFGDDDAVVAAVRSLRADPARARASGLRGHEYVAAHHSWNVDGSRFVEQLATWAALRPISAA